MYKLYAIIISKGKLKIYDLIANYGNFMLSRINKIGIRDFPAVFPGRTVPLYAIITGCGHQHRTSTDYNNYGLKRGNAEFTIWQYTLGGWGILEIEGKSYKLTPGKAMLLHIPQNHRYYLPKESEFWDFIYISTHGREIMRLWHELEKVSGPIVELDETSNSLKTFTEIFEKAATGKLNSQFKASAMAYQMQMSLMDDLLPSATGKGKVPEFMKNVISFCQENIERNINVDDMAEISGYSRYHFSRLFSEYQGISPAAFLSELRMKQAIRLLHAEFLTVKEIALKCGFQDASYFCKTFRRSFGVSPDEFRKSGTPN